MTVTIKVSKEELEYIKESVLIRQMEYKRQAEVCGRAWNALFLAEEEKCPVEN